MGVSASALSTCRKFAGDGDMQTEMLPGEEGAVAPPMVVEESPKLGLRIFSNPCKDSNGGALCARFLNLGDEIIATELEKVHEWDCLRARFEFSAKQNAGALYQSAMQTSAQPRLQLPQTHRFVNPRRFWRTKIVSQDTQGGFQEHECMLVVAANTEDRTRANIEADLKDAADVASYASRFNKQLGQLYGENEGVPGVKVCGPVGCEIIKSSSHEFARPGEVIQVIPYPFADVKKFLFDGSEDFLEIPQAFFHHAAWLSSSNEFIYDLQGVEDDDGNLILVDPCVIRADKPSVGDLLGTLATSATQKENMPASNGDISSMIFDALHPRCGQCCKQFDPHRRSANCKRHCGLNLSCGLK